MTALALPLLLNVFVDYVLSGREPSWGGDLVIGATVAAGLVYLLTWLRERSLRRLSVRLLALGRADHFIGHLYFRLRTEFFAHRYAGDLTARMQSINEVATVATGLSLTFAGVGIELATARASCSWR